METQEQRTEQVGEIFLTPRAAEELKKIKVANNIPESHALRIGIKEGGCCGFSYVLGFDEDAHPTDRKFALEGMSVYVDPKSMESLAGTTLDFVEDAEGRGFVFDNPNEQKSCDCGDSSCH